MVMRKPPYHARMNSVAFYTFWCAVLLMPVIAALPASMQHTTGHSKSALTLAAGNTPLISSGQSDSLLPRVLSKDDIALYQNIFRAQKQADWTRADTDIAKLQNPLLLGHVLAARYLDRRYNESAEQLTQWLNKYSDHPEAADVYAIALSKNPSLKYDVPLVQKQASLEGYGDDNGLVTTRGEEPPYLNTWHAGLQAWKSGHKDVAAKLFSTMSSQYQMSPWMESAAAYWAFRSFSAIGKQDEATTYLKIAAQHPRSFYGILARKQLKQDLDLDLKPVELTDSDVLAMVGDQAIRRVVALSQGGFTEMAEKELRLRFPQGDDSEKPRLLALAHELGLASVQISMAKQLRSSDHELDFARYPLPHWQPEGGFRVDPLLIYSLMRQESGFRPSAVSPGGALGLMQLMPQTASLMQKKTTSGISATATNVSEPIPNITLGQDYVEHLLNNNLVEGNLFYLLAAYNAGPGRLQEWKARLTDNRDPLLFVESIPFGQTRNYVMQVMTNYWIYSELDGSANRSIYAVLQGHWPSYEPYAGTVAAKNLVTLFPGGA